MPLENHTSLSSLFILLIIGTEIIYSEDSHVARLLLSN